LFDLSEYIGKRVLITGHTGFKGTWLTRILLEAGALVYGISLKSEKNSLFSLVGDHGLVKSIYLDIKDSQKLNRIIKNIDPHITFHLAAQSLVKISYEEPLNTFQTNVMGTANMLDATLPGKSMVGFIAVTTDKVYKNSDNLEGHIENDPLGGYDPYSASKSACEMVITAWQNISNIRSKVPIVSVRSGNVIGGGDRAHERLVPELIRSFRGNSVARIRNPDSIRPWQHVLDPLNGYLIVGSKMLRGDEISNSYNFGPSLESKLTVSQLANALCLQWPNNKGWVVDLSPRNFHESRILILNSQRAKTELDWENKLSVSEAVKWTVDWELNLKKGNALELIKSQINKFKAINR
jgi:CDP-glucose 4,6-dehydratase